MTTQAHINDLIPASRKIRLIQKRRDMTLNEVAHHISQPKQVVHNWAQEISRPDAEGERRLDQLFQLALATTPNGQAAVADEKPRTYPKTMQGLCDRVLFRGSPELAMAIKAATKWTYVELSNCLGQPPPPEEQNHHRGRGGNTCKNDRVGRSTIKNWCIGHRPMPPWARQRIGKIARWIKEHDGAIPQAKDFDWYVASVKPIIKFEVDEKVTAKDLNDEFDNIHQAHVDAPEVPEVAKPISGWPVVVGAAMAGAAAASAALWVWMGV